MKKNKFNFLQNIKTVKTLKILTYLLSIPTFLICAIALSIHVIKDGASYGAPAYTGLIIAIIFSAIWFALVVGFELSFKKFKNKSKTLNTQCGSLLAITLVFIVGITLVMDIVLPPLLPEPTSKTIFYEDLADDANGRADINKDLLDSFIARNVINGNIGQTPLMSSGLNKNKVEEKIAYYQKQGYKNKEVKNLLDEKSSQNLFNSFDTDGYKSFIGPWIDMANDGRMTPQVLLKLVLGQRDILKNENKDGTYTTTNKLHDAYIFNKYTKKLEKVQYRWTVLDILGKPMAMEIDTSGLSSTITSLISKYSAVLNMALDDITKPIASDNVVGDNIKIKMTNANDKINISLVPNNEARGVLSYQNQAWLQKNKLLYMLSSIMALRQLSYIYAGISIVLMIFTYLLRKRELDLSETINSAIKKQ